MKKKTKNKVKIKIETYVDGVFKFDETCTQFVWVKDGKLVIKFGGQNLPINLTEDGWIAKREIMTLRMNKPTFWKGV